MSLKKDSVGMRIVYLKRILSCRKKKKKKGRERERERIKWERERVSKDKGRKSAIV